MKQNLDILLTQALQAWAADVQPDKNQISNIKREIRIRKDEKNMKFAMKRIIAIAAAACLICASCFAAVQISSVQTQSTADITAYEDIAAAAKALHIDAKYVRSFANGFAFELAATTSTRANDAAGNPFGKTYAGLDIEYKDAEGRILNLGITDGDPDVDNGEAAASGYSSAAFKFVPPDYALTEEDVRLESEGNFFISYGSQQVELKQYEGYHWQADGLYYSLSAFDCNLGEAALAQMAQEIMG